MSLVAQIHLSKIDILICVRHVQNHIEWVPNDIGVVRRRATNVAIAQFIGI